jgi:hypothetical protein
VSSVGAAAGPHTPTLTGRPHRNLTAISPTTGERAAGGGRRGPTTAAGAAGWDEATLAEALRPLLAEHDATPPDCPPSLGLPTLMALIAADRALVPVAPGGADARELSGLPAALERLRASRRAPRLESTGVVVTHGSGTTAAMAAMLAGLSGAGPTPTVVGEAPAEVGGVAGQGYAAIAGQLLGYP